MRKICLILVIVSFCLSNSYSQVGKLVDEDFTDGVFDDYGSGINGANWKFYGPGTSFKSTNGRVPTMALSNRVSANGGGWADGAQWRVWTDKNSDNGFNDDELVYWKLHKYNDVCVVKFTTFSDYCYKNNFGGVEVAFLEWRDAPVIQAPPHYGHDQSWETMHCYYTSPGNGGQPNQLETNVENTNPANTSIPGFSYVHKNTWYDAAFLEGSQTSTVLWRNEPKIKKCNIEQWGMLNSGDFYLDTMLVSLQEPNREYNLFSYMQITFFRGIPSLPTSQYINKSGVNFSDVQLGITHLEFGITRRTDFNLDYVVDAKDADTIVKYNGTNTDISMLKGDANNDEVVDMYDANQMIGLWTDVSTGVSSASGVYNPSTGAITLNMNGISYFSLECSVTGAWGGSAPTFTGFVPDAATDNDNVIACFTRNRWDNLQNINIGTVAQTGLNPSEMFLVVNFKGSGKVDGVKIPLNGTSFYTNIKLPTKDNTVFEIFPNPCSDFLHFKTNESLSTQIEIYDMLGNQINLKNKISNNQIDIRLLKSGIYVLLYKTDNKITKKKFIKQ